MYRLPVAVGPITLAAHKWFKRPTLLTGNTLNVVGSQPVSCGAVLVNISDVEVIPVGNHDANPYHNMPAGVPVRG